MFVEDAMKTSNPSSVRVLQSMDERQQRIHRDRAQKREWESTNRQEINLTESVEQFWCTFNERKKSFSRVFLEDLKLDEAQRHYVTAAQRHEGKKRLDEVQQGLLELQKYSSQCASLFLPQADARRINEEMERLFQQLRHAREVVCPREKFTFQKYRTWRTQQHDAVLIDQEQQENNYEDNDTSSHRTTPPCHNDDRLFGLDSQVNSYLSSDDIILVETTAPQKINLHLTHLQNCVVTLKESYGSLKLQDNHNCIFYCSPVSGPIFVERCHNCTLIVASRQLRIHDSYSLHCIIYVTSGPIIEGCSKIWFSRLYAPTLQNRFAISNPPVDINVLQRIAMSSNLIHDMDPKILDAQNEYHNVKDFMWHKLLQQSPNWSLLTDDETREFLLQLSDERRQSNIPY